MKFSATFEIKLEDGYSSIKEIFRRRKYKEFDTIFISKYLKKGTKDTFVYKVEFKLFEMQIFLQHYPRNSMEYTSIMSASYERKGLMLFDLVFKDDFNNITSRKIVSDNTRYTL